jgi:hypothetical protein
MYEKPQQAIIHYYLHPQPYYYFYRPLQDSYHGFVQTYFGLETWPIQCTHIVLHALLVWMIFRLMLALSFSPFQATAGALFMAFAQVNVIAIVRNSTIAQVASTLAGFSALYFLCWEHLRRKEIGDEERCKSLLRPWIASLVLFVVALLLKESATSFLLLVPFVLFLLHRNVRPYTNLWLSVGVKTVPYVVIFIIYFIIRSQVVTSHFKWGATDDTSEYLFCVGPNVVRNLGMFLCATLTPFSTAEVFIAFKNSEPWNLFVLYLVVTALFAAIILWGLWQHRKPWLFVAVVGCYLLSFFPMVLLTHVGELYVYNAMPYASILVGAGVGKFIEVQYRRRFAMALSIVFFLAILTSNFWAVRHKIVLLREKGDRAATLLTQVVPIIQSLPPNAKLLLINPPPRQPEYSAFYLNYFSVLRFARGYISSLSGRPDVTVWVLPQDDPNYRPADAWSVCLSNGQMVVMAPQGNDSVKNNSLGF